MLQERPQSRRVWIVAVLAAAGLILTLLFSRMVYVHELGVVETEFVARAQERALSLQRELTTALVAVESLQAFFHASHEVEREEFTSFARPLLQRHPEILAFGFNPVVTHSERAQFEAEQASAGLDRFQITEQAPDGSLVPAAERPDYVAVKYIWPAEGNERAISFDINSEPVRREAVQRTRTTRQFTATAPLRLVQEPEGQKGFLLFGPILEDPRRPESRVIGLAVAVYRVGDLVEQALAPLRPLDAQLAVFDNTSPNTPSLAYAHPHPAGAPSLDFRSSPTSLHFDHPIPVAGRRWIMRTVASDSYLADNRSGNWILTLIMGFVMTTLLVVYVARLARLNDRLQQKEAKFRQLAENIKEVFWMSDLRVPEMIYVSPAYEDIWGKSVESLYEDASSFLEAVLLKDREPLDVAIADQLAGRQTSTEYRILRPDGELRWIWDRGFPVFDVDGRVTHVVGIAEDVTDRKRLETRMQQVQKLEGLGSLAGGVAHDFNNLLTAILGHASLARGSVPRDGPADQHLMQIETSSQRAAELTAQLLTYAGRSTVQLDRVALSPLVEELSRLFETTVASTASIRYDLEDGLPLVEGDANQLRQLCLNLITNAVEAIADLSGEIRITTGSLVADSEYLSRSYFETDLPAGEYVFVEVADTGCGMDSDTLDHIFDPFFTTKFTGRGLGLVSAVGIVQSHRGAILVETRERVGSVFRILLPVAAPDEIPARASPPERREPESAPRSFAGTVLIIDDDPQIRAVTGSLLRRAGAEVLTADGGVSGLEIIESQRTLHAVLLDLTMPGLHGVEVFHRIRSMAPNLPVILCSGYSERDLRARYRDEGFAGFLMKPYEPSELLEALERASTYADLKP